ncbi:MAG: response regulator [Rhodospirillaceae bacterium]
MSRGRILIADDNKTMIAFVQSALELLGYFEVDTVGNGSHALDMILRTPYALVVLDHEMPGMKGLEIIRATARLRQGAVPAIVLITATVSPEIVEAIQLERLPVSALIAKPFSIQEFQKRIAKIRIQQTSSGTLDTDEGHVRRTLYYGETPRLAIKVIDTGNFVGALFRGRPCREDGATIKFAFDAAIAAKPQIVVANVSEVENPDEFFLGFLLIFLGTFIDSGRRSFAILGDKPGCNRFITLGFDQLIPSYDTAEKFYLEIGYDPNADSKT